VVAEIPEKKNEAMNRGMGGGMGMDM